MTLEEALRWARRIAMENVNPRHPDFEDVAQEAEIAVWRLLEKTPDAGPTLVATAAKRASWGAHYKGRRTGATMRARGAGPEWQPESVTSTEALADAGVLEEMVPPAADHAEALAEASEVRSAVRRLDERARLFVWLRFYEERTLEEIGAHFGMTKGGASSWWKERIAPELREILGGSALGALT